MSDRFVPTNVNGYGFRIREADGGVSLVSASPSKSGEPMQPGQEIATFKKREDGSFDITTVYKHGPSRLTTPAYASGWERIFGKDAN